MGVARLGCPWIDCLMEYARQDDRGNAFALWRKVDSDDLAEEQVGRVFFRLDYIVEANLGDDENPSLKRKADSVFPPIYKTLWVDQNLEVPNEEIQGWLDEPYCSSEDVNIRPQYWPRVLELLQINDWVGLCDHVRLVVDQLFREQTDLMNIIQASVNRFDGDNQVMIDQFESRLGCFAEQDLSLNRDIEEMKHISKKIHAAIREPKVRLDSCGAVILARDAFQVPEGIGN